MKEIPMQNSPWIRMEQVEWQELLRDEYIVEQPKQTYVFHEGDTMDCCYIVESGRVLLSAYNKDGREMIVLFVARGGIFADSCLFGEEQMPYSARTVADTRLYRIPCQVMLEKLKTNPAIAMTLMTVQHKKESSLVHSLTSLTFMDAYERAANELIYCAETYGQTNENGIYIGIPITQEQFGRRIGANRNTVGKIIKQMTGEGLIVHKGKHFILLDLEGLKKISET